MLTTKLGLAGLKKMEDGVTSEEGRQFRTDTKTQIQEQMERAQDPNVTADTSLTLQKNQVIRQPQLMKTFGTQAYLKPRLELFASMTGQKLQPQRGHQNVE